MASATTEQRASDRVVPVIGRVIGIDPGLNVTGYAVVEPGPNGAVVVEAGVIRSSSPKAPMGERLETLHSGLIEVLEAFPATSLAIEQVHSHVRHPRTAILMAHARSDHARGDSTRVAGLWIRRLANQENADRERQGTEGPDATRH